MAWSAALRKKVKRELQKYGQWRPARPAQQGPVVNVLRKDESRDGSSLTWVYILKGTNRQILAWAREHLYVYGSGVLADYSPTGRWHSDRIRWHRMGDRVVIRQRVWLDI